MIDILQVITKRGKTVYLYEQLLARESKNNDVIFANSLQELNCKSDIIVTNIFTEELIPYKHKVYTRDFMFVWKSENDRERVSKKEFIERYRIGE